MLNLDDTSRCPGGPGYRCESCGAEGDGLTVVTVRLASLGVACMTLCKACAASKITPPVTVSTAARLTLQHCLHLGCTIDEMAEALDA